MRLSHFPTVSALLALAIAMPGTLPARAEGTLTAQYFLLPATHPDVMKGVDGSIVRGLFADRLDSNNLPVVTAFGRRIEGHTDGAGDPAYNRVSRAGARRASRRTSSLDSASQRRDSKRKATGQIDRSLRTKRSREGR